MGVSIDFNKGISVIRNYPGGSNAVTILCMDDHGTFYRKYALGSDVEKLWQQILWIEDNKDRLPLPRIIKKEKTESYCFYDMEYVSHSAGLFEYSHSMPTDQTWNIIRNVLKKSEEALYRTGRVFADQATVHRYCEEKIRRNIDFMRKSFLLKDLMNYEVLVINGKEYPNLSHYSRILSEDNLQEVFSRDRYCGIHGDLTTENIICTRNEQGEEDFYLIDPNTGNIHNSANLDYAKILQSVHGEYEFIKTAKEVSASGNRICFSYTHSIVYAELNRMFKDYLEENFDRDEVRSIYLHEIVHWLRLMPYKLKNEPDRAPAFYAKMLVVMDEVAQMFYGGKE